jgi:hypothetical protein
MSRAGNQALHASTSVLLGLAFSSEYAREALLWIVSWLSQDYESLRAHGITSQKTGLKLRRVNILYKHIPREPKYLIGFIIKKQKIQKA